MSLSSPSFHCDHVSGQQAIASMTRFLLDSNAVLSATSGSDEEVFKPAAVVGSAASMLMSGGVDLNQSAALEPAIVSIAGPMINSANDLQGVQKMTKKVANVQLLLPAKIVDIEAKILLRTDLRSSNPQYVSVQPLRSMMGRCNQIILI